MRPRKFMYDLSIKTLKEIFTKNRGVFPFISREVVTDKDAGTFWCRKYERGYAKGSCGEACPHYSPKNGDTGACAHFGHIHKYGDVYEIRKAPASLRAIYVGMNSQPSHQPRIVPGYRHVMRSGEITGVIRPMTPDERNEHEGRYAYMYTDDRWTWTPDGDYFSPDHGVRVTSDRDIVSRHYSDLTKRGF